MDLLIVLCAKYLVWVVVLVGLVFFMRSAHKTRLAISATLGLALTYAAGLIEGALWYDPRPFVSEGVVPLIAHAANNGFPSDHMLLGAAIASVVFAYDRGWGLLLWALALVVGAARVLAGIHHLVDLAGSIAAAICVVAAVEYALRRWYPSAGIVEG